MDSSTVKSLQVFRNKYQSELDVKVAEREEVNNRIKELERLIQETNAKIAAYLKEPNVSEHALLRYAERVLGFDSEEITGMILTEANIEAINTLRDCKLPLPNGATAIIKEKTVVTILPKERSRLEGNSKTLGVATSP